MPKTPAAAVRISSPADIVVALSRILGFMPSESVVALCLQDTHHRLGLAMRFDLELARDPAAFAAAVDARVRTEQADGLIVVVFSGKPPLGSPLPFAEVVERLQETTGDLLVDVLYVAEDRWWSYLCDDPACCPAAGGLVDPRSPGATAVAAAYALAGHGVLPSREAVVSSLGFDGDDADAGRIGEIVAAALARQADQPQAVRRRAIRALASRLSAERPDPRHRVGAVDAVQLAALCEDVVVRDELLVRALRPRRRAALLRIVAEVVRRIPPPFDAPICATLAWIAYANGDGVVANVAIDRALATDPEYPLALLIADALDRQVPPWLLEEVMRSAARDLKATSSAR